MSLIFCEGFDDLDAVEQIDKRYSIDTNSIAIVDGRHNGKALQFSGFSTSTTYYWNLPHPTMSEGVLGFAFRSTSMTGHEMIYWVGSAGSNYLLFSQTTGKFSWDINDTGGTIHYSDKILLPDVWYYIEVKFKFQASNVLGDNVVKCNGETILEIPAGVTTRLQGGVTSCPRTAFAYYHSGAGTYAVDDVYLIKTDDGIAPTDYLGDSTVTPLYPDGNGTTSDFIGSDGNSVNNYQQFYTPPSGVVSYVEASGVNDLDLYTMQDINNVDTVHAVEFVSNAKRTKTGDDINYRPVFRLGGTNYYGSGLYPSTDSFGYHRKPYGENPDTSTAWTENDINNMEVGVGIF
jgi:hypothetical protein